MDVANPLLGLLEQRLRELDVPLAITLWNGQRVTPAEKPRASVTVRSPKVLASLVHPTMGKLARYYVEEDLDLDGEAKLLIRVAEALSGIGGAPNGTTARLWKLLGHTRMFDRKSIRYHYDINDDFF